MAAQLEELTIEQLAQRTGMTVRNIREWQTMGLLPPPTKRGRVGFYNDEHLTRVGRVRLLQAEGLPLELIRRVFEQSAESLDSAISRVVRAALEPFQDEPPQTMDEAELRQRLRLGPEQSWTVLDPLGLFEHVSGKRIRVHSQQLMRALERAVELGVPAAVLAEQLGRIRQHQDAIAQIVVGIYRDQLWGPFVRAGLPTDRWPELADAMEQLRPAVLQAMVALARLALDDAARDAIIKGAGQLKPDEAE